MPDEPPPSLPPLQSADLADREALAAWVRQFLDHLPTDGGDAGVLGGNPGDVFGMDRRNPVIDVPDPPLHPTLVTAKLMLDGSKPPIWRRLEIRGDLTLDAVHRHLQAAMGWLDGHLHRFEPGPVKQRWMSPFFLTEFDIDEGEEGTPESDVRLDQVVRAVGDRLFYTYDFGDDWGHTLTVERLRPATADDPPMRCLKAVRACPAEDVGGIGAWNELAAALRANPDPSALTGDLEMYAGWLEPDVEPEHVDVDDINLALSLVDADPAELLARLRAEGGDEGPELAAAYQDVIDKAPADLVLHLASLFSLASTVDPPQPSDTELAELVRPWQVLLDVAGEDGIPLTKAGWMSPAACERIWREGGLDWGYGKGNREQFTPELSFVRDTAVAARIVRVYRGRVVRTKFGYAASTDLDVLVGAIAALLLRAPAGADRDEAVLTTLLLATGPDDDPAEDAVEGPAALPARVPRHEEFFDEVARLMTWLGWRVEGRPIHRHELRRAHDVIRILALSERGGIFARLPSRPAARAVARRALTTS